MNRKLKTLTVAFKNPDGSLFVEEVEEESDYVNRAVCTVDTTPVTSDKKSPSFTQSYLPIAVSWVILLVIMALRIHFTTVITENNGRLRAEIQQLKTQRNNLKGQMENRKSEQNTIETQAQWIVDAYCPKKKNSENRQCKACQKGWHHFQSSCYEINNVDASNQRTWEEAQNNCRGQNADLVVIGSPEEQEFIYNRSWSSWGNSGYLIGLRVEAGIWKWVDGSDLTAEYWIQKPSDNTHCAIFIEETSPKGWNAVDCNKVNRWICEKKALSI